MQTTITILGAGSWGTALALQLAKNDHQINLWEFDKNLVQKLFLFSHHKV